MMFLRGQVIFQLKSPVLFSEKEEHHNKKED
jgi:hypothetical protein